MALLYIYLMQYTVVLIVVSPQQLFGINCCCVLCDTLLRGELEGRPALVGRVLQQKTKAPNGPNPFFFSTEVENKTKRDNLIRMWGICF